mmetsp:Transcript_4971/g.5497  ORF Transcript_4971/g.5497 Transcript_4971/m.5497 type:complete len:401 (+) Transcript_4971:1232-2434(+)
MARSSNEYYPVILDISSTFIRAGFAGDSLPLVTINSVDQNDQSSLSKVPPYYNVNDASMTSEQHDMVISSMLSSSPIIKRVSEIYTRDHSLARHSNGIYGNKLQLILSDIFINHLLISPSRAKIILVDSSYSILDKSRISKILLCKIGVKSIIWTPESSLHVIGANSINGLVVNVRWDALLVNSIIDLRIISHSEKSDNFNGNALHYKMIEKLIELDDEDANTLLKSSDLFDIIENFIANAVYVRPIDDTKDDTRLFQISEGINIPNRLRYEVVESLFFEEDNLSQLIASTVIKSPIDVRAILLENLIITGETSNIPGFKSRLIRDVRKLVTGNVSCKVTLGLWAGCSLYCSTTLVRQNEKVWKSQEITKETITKSISPDGIYLTNIPDAFNSLYKNSSI